jgi:hypothetical protein
MKFKHVHNLLEKALNCLLVNDEFLLINDLNERTITHKLAEYLQKEFPGWNVDSEYNRKMGQVKRISYKNVQSDDSDAKTVYPDIIIHRRNTEDNLLIIEIKKNASINGMKKDEIKIKEFMREHNYNYGIFIDFKTGVGKLGIRQIKQIEKPSPP